LQAHPRSAHATCPQGFSTLLPPFCPRVGHNVFGTMPSVALSALLPCGRVQSPHRSHAPPRRNALRVRATAAADTARGAMAMQGLHLRQATSADVASIAKLCAGCFADAALELYPPGARRAANPNVLLF
jgi:hypothetical protein